MSKGQCARSHRSVCGAWLVSALLMLAATFGRVDSASAQLFQWTPEQLIKYTSKNPYDRFPDGRPKVPDAMLERLKGLVAEEVQAVLPARGFPQPVRVSRGLEGAAAGSEDGRPRLHRAVHACPRRRRSTWTKPMRRQKARSAGAQPDGNRHAAAGRRHRRRRLRRRSGTSSATSSRTTSRRPRRTA